MQLDIITPDGPVWSGDTEAVRVPGTRGQFEVLRNHAPIISTLTPGAVRIRQADGRHVCFEIAGGVLEVSQNRLTLLTARARPVQPDAQPALRPS